MNKYIVATILGLFVHGCTGQRLQVLDNVGISEASIGYGADISFDHELIFDDAVLSFVDNIVKHAKLIYSERRGAREICCSFYYKDIRQRHTGGFPHHDVTVAVCYRVAKCDYGAPCIRELGIRIFNMSRGKDNVIVSEIDKTSEYFFSQMVEQFGRKNIRFSRGLAFY